MALLSRKGLMGVPSILLLEDNPHDVLLLQEAITQCDKHIDLQVVSSIAEARSLLTDLPADSGIKLLVTDRYLRDGCGLEFIKSLRQNKQLIHMQMVMVSGEVCCPADIGEIAWFNKPDTWDKWHSLAQLLIKQMTKE
jgi:CheY-like chemotaxis protein